MEINFLYYFISKKNRIKLLRKILKLLVYYYNIFSTKYLQIDVIKYA